MTSRSNQTHREAGLAGIRLSLWLFVICSLLVLVVAIRLSRQPATPAPKSTRTVADTANRDPTAPGSANPVSYKAAPRTEPRQKTPSDWVLDLESTNAEVVSAASQALAELGQDAAPAIPQLAQMLNDGRTCNRAAWALVKIGTNSLPALFDMLTNGNKYARLEVAGAIGWFREAGEGAVPGLIECMKYDDPGVRGNAIASLQAIPKRPDIAVPALIAALGDSESSVRQNAATVLQKYGQTEAQTTIPMLVQAAGQDENSLIRFRVAEVLRAVAPDRAKAEGL